MYYSVGYNASHAPIQTIGMTSNNRFNLAESNNPKKHVFAIENTVLASCLPVSFQ